MTILLSHIISARPSKQPLMVRTFLKVYMEIGFYSLFLQEQIKDIIINIRGTSSICLAMPLEGLDGIARHLDPVRTPRSVQPICGTTHLRGHAAQARRTDHLLKNEFKRDLRLTENSTYHINIRNSVSMYSSFFADMAFGFYDSGGTKLILKCDLVQVQYQLCTRYKVD